MVSAFVAQLDAHSMGGLTPAGLATFVKNTHQIFSTLILSLLLIQEGSCQFLAKECAKYELTA